MRTTIHTLAQMKERGERIVMITAYDYTAAQLVDRAGIPAILVGDSLGMVVQGHNSTLPVTLDDMIYHTRAVVRGSQQALVIADMPFLTYTTADEAIHNAGRLLQEAGAHAVKLEGGKPMVPIVRHLVERGIPVMGHLGFTPQSVHQLGTRVQGRSTTAATQLVADAQALADAGAFGVVLELVPAPLARAITQRLPIPTIGIGAGADCDGQVQVWHDMLGLYTDFVPRHTRRYTTLADTIVAALTAYHDDVQHSLFPTEAHTSTIEDDVLQSALKRLDY